MFTEPTALILDALDDDATRQPSIVVATDDGRSARRIAATIGRLVSSGTLEVGTRLPTVRELSRRLGVSPTTVSEAWRRLADVGAIETRGRNGTFVRHPTGPGGPRRYRQITEGPGHFALDLSSGTPDPDLLPDLSPIVATVSRQSLTSSYLDHPVLPALEEKLRATWPFDPEAITVVDGALDALDRVAGVALRLGDRVVVEHPGFPPMLDLLERLACDVIGVDVDDEGLDIAQLRAVLAGGATAAVILQPRAQNPAGVALSPRRAQAIADAVRSAGTTLVVEDDHANEISSAPLVSVGAWLPERTVHIRSFSKSHGPDLRLAAVGGAGSVVTAVENRRLLGPGWSSRILQSVLLGLIGHPATADALDVARAAYAERRREVSRVLVDKGVEVTGTDGINLWMAVEDERAAVVALAAQGIGVAPGTPFLVRPDSDHLRVTVGVLSPERGLTQVARQLAAAAVLGDLRRRHNR
jgi:DNA-binding transcriptional MocR family regulator